MPLPSDNIPDLTQIPSTSDVILKYIRSSIIDGSLAGGEAIRQDEVAQLFNVSKIPVREALKQLESEGFVEFKRNKGAIVTELTEPEIVQIFEMRAILESRTVELSIPNMTKESLEKASLYCHQFQEEKDVSKWALLNWQFHSSLFEDANRPFFVKTIRSLNDRLERYLRIQLSLSHGKNLADKEHLLLLNACRDKNVSYAGELLYSHIMSACKSLRSSLSLIK